MGPKGKILVTCLLFFITIALLGGIFILLQLANTNQNQQDNNIGEDSDPNIIDPEDINNPKRYKFAAITPEDTLKLFDEQGKELVINLEHKQWIDVKWSLDRNFLSALGIDDSNLPNIFLYSSSEGQWEQVTNYEDIGIEQQVWQTDSNIFYTHGEDPERWIHRFKESARSELFKLIKTQGSIEEISSNFNKIIVSPHIVAGGNSTTTYGKWEGYLADGTKDWDLSVISVEQRLEEILEESTTEEENLNISDVLFSTNSEKVLITAVNEDKTISYYKTLWGSNLAVKLDNVEKGYIPLCAVNEDVFMGYTVDPELRIVQLYNYNIKNEESIYITEQRIGEGYVLDEENTLCYDINNILLKFMPQTLENETESDKDPVQWYTLSNDRKTVEEITFLKGMKDVDVR